MRLLPFVASLVGPIFALPAIDSNEVLSRVHHSNKQILHGAYLVREETKIPEIKQFSENIIRDHQKWEERLDRLVKNHKATLENPKPRSDGEKKRLLQEQKNWQRMQIIKEQRIKQEGNAVELIFTHNLFDSYSELIRMVQDYLEIHRTAGDKTNSAEASAYLAQLLPALKQNKSKAEDLYKKLKNKKDF